LPAFAVAISAIERHFDSCRHFAFTFSIFAADTLHLRHFLSFTPPPACFHLFRRRVYAITPLLFFISMLSFSLTFSLFSLMPLFHFADTPLPLSAAAAAITTISRHCFSPPPRHYCRFRFHYAFIFADDISH
jgi:hypothetical protein